VYSYLPLVQQIDKTRPVYVLDDGVMTSGKEFPFESIEHVARTCLPFVQAIAAKHSTGSGAGGEQVVTLAGWSYGGVVASAVAKLLSGAAVSAQEAGAIRVNALVLFDSPLRAPKKASSAENDEEEGVHTTAPIIESEAADSAALDLQARTQRHFRACTDLLRKFHNEQGECAAGDEKASQPLRCAIADVRPEQTDYDCGIEAAAELTSGDAVRITVPGTHWTMLFQDNVVSVGKAIRAFL
jgi:thioesterase domain-containing protein